MPLNGRSFQDLIIAQQLDYNLPADISALSKIDNGHPALALQTQQPVRPDLLVDQRRQGPGSDYIQRAIQRQNVPGLRKSVHTWHKFIRGHQHLGAWHSLAAPLPRARGALLSLRFAVSDVAAISGE